MVCLLPVERVVQLPVRDQRVAVGVGGEADVIDLSRRTAVGVVERQKAVEELDCIEEAARRVGVAAHDEDLADVQRAEPCVDLAQVFGRPHHPRRDVGDDRVAGCDQARRLVEGRLDRLRG